MDRQAGLGVRSRSEGVIDVSGSEVLDVARESIWVMLQLAGPLMGIGLGVGVAISLLQALTQVQEQTLVFVPKIVSMFLALLIFLPFMGAVLSGFMARMAERIANLN